MLSTSSNSKVKSTLTYDREVCELSNKWENKLLITESYHLSKGTRKEGVLHSRNEEI